MMVSSTALHAATIKASKFVFWKQKCTFNSWDLNHNHHVMIQHVMIRGASGCTAARSKSRSSTFRMNQYESTAKHYKYAKKKQVKA
jgi:hypothetical protein